MLYTVLVTIPFIVTLGLAIIRWTALASLLALVFAVPAVRRVQSGALGAELVPALRDTGLAMLVWACALALSLGS
jgi:1,4-dihydroxy-2-naphthoate octaprenyltransferase